MAEQYDLNSIIHYLASNICELLGIKNINIQENLFNYGLDSLKAIVIVNLIQKNFKCKLPISFLYVNPSIHKMAIYIEGNVNN